ncbi:MAG: alpha/beta hydrolase [Verrucomicrobia bacterium]|jgi:esterase/lipase superfamily enzyme|nr:alpha/beta hydrolase [Verrucomicrobiota bacterium]|tara:strand:- start:3755 stop:4084 length:330 start_codon:yes stop_codon:yes gene_type:complete
MGNRAFANVLPAVHRSSKRNQVIKEVILAAPDIDAKVFRKDIAPRLINGGSDTTIYSSSRDKALWASWLLHGFAPRAGQRVSGLQGLESIDAGTIDTRTLGLGHSYYAK